MKDNALLQLLQRADATPGFGSARVVHIGGRRVFAKSLPLTHRELERGYSTENVFRLPAFFHYGVGSAGFGPFRELAAHTKTSQWVVRGKIDAFPLMYHHRILPIFGEALPLRDDELEEYVAYWDGSAEIRAYMLARRKAEKHLVLFIEYVPHVLRSWLGAHLDQLKMVMVGMHRIIEFLRERGVSHFDAHLGNILTDGKQVFLTDFGLALDEEFALDEEERAFFEAHRHYDAGTFLRSLRWPALQMADAWDDATRREVSTRHGDTSFATLLDNLEELVDSETLPLPGAYVDILLQYRDAIRVMDRVVTALRTGLKLRGGYDDNQLRRALQGARSRSPS